MKFTKGQTVWIINSRRSRAFKGYVDHVEPNGLADVFNIDKEEFQRFSASTGEAILEQMLRTSGPKIVPFTDPEALALNAVYEYREFSEKLQEAARVAVSDYDFGFHQLRQVVDAWEAYRDANEDDIARGWDQYLGLS